ncbi:MAG: glycosyltransferase family 39 protein [Candidatus Moranbacteria bacterium]|nr:glycosyltransferase family 39 protein [Candidatus Moranbacteria bacterium]
MNKKTIHILIIFAVITTNLFFGLPRLARYTAVDETLWSYDRVPKFWRSIEKGNWRGTNLCDKPGVTLAMVSGLGLPFIPDPRDYEKLQFQSKTPEQLAMIEKIYFSLRLPVYLFTLASLFAFYFLLKRLLSDDIALLAVIFIGLSPILLGISLIVNTDAILWILMPLTLISFLIYQKEDNRKFLYLAGVLLGLGILDKFVANFLFPFLLALVLLKYVLSDHAQTEDKVRFLKKSMADYLILIAIALVTIFIFYPSAWIKPKEILNTTIYSMALRKMWPLVMGAIALILADVFLLRSAILRKILDFFSTHRILLIRLASLAILGMVAFVFVNTYSGMKPYDFQEILSNPKPDMPFVNEFPLNFFSAFFPLLFGLIPLAAIAFIAAIVFLVKIRPSDTLPENSLIYAFYFLLFILVFYLGNSVSSIGSTVRYQIVNYPVAAIIAAIGLSGMAKFGPVKKYFLGIKFYLLVGFIFIISIISLTQTKPFFLAYSSSLLPDRFMTNLKDMGDGSWETSHYLNSLPGAERLVIWSDKKQVCEKFVGRCKTGFRYKDLVNFKFDYLIVSAGGKAETLSRSSQRKSTFESAFGPINVEKLYAPDGYSDFKVNIDDKLEDFIKVVNPATISND